ncbi:MAG: MiaB/RimO family radical SAM methylthiotransferase [Clostridia bacterium]|nr:MiaB/RimO family radical SAM methylthiotransferase [Clostridia bacterium]
MSIEGKTFTICTLGCRVNIAESRGIKEALVAAGMREAEEGETPDLAIVNTCAVTAESERKSRQAIRRAYGDGVKVVVTGCMPEIHRVSEAGVTVVPNSVKSNIPHIAAGLFGSPDAAEEYFGCALPVSGSDGVHGYIKIEDGCDNVCSYCVIKRARGRVVSRPAAEITEEAKRLAGAGFREIVLTGIEVASYGRDSGESLADVIAGVSGVEGVDRIRLGSVEPTLLRGDFPFRLAETGKFSPWFHLSLQSGSSRVLAAMRRKYNREMELSAVENVKKAFPGASFSADIIAGFPGESDAEFEETVSLCREIQLLHIHAFPFSPRPGTEAAGMKEQIPAAVKKERMKTLTALDAELKSGIYREAAERKALLSVLVEQKKGEYFFGHSREMYETYIAADGEIPAGGIVEARAASGDRRGVFAKPI